MSSNGQDSSYNFQRQNHAPPPPPPPPPRVIPSGFQSTVGYGYGYNYNNLAGAQLYPSPASAVPIHPHQSNHSNQRPPAHAPSSLASNIHNASQPPRQEPPVSVWKCVPCKMSMDSEKALQQHQNSHIKCTHCDFQASPKVVKGHFDTSHGRLSGSGFKTVTVAVPGCRVQRFKICVGNRPTDIQKWIADRKKRFPRQPKPPTKEEKSEAQLSCMLDGYGSSSDSENDDSNKKKSDNQEAAQNAASQRSNRSARVCKFYLRNGTCRNGDACRFSHDITKGMGSSRIFRNNRKETSKAGPSSLLRKLLSQDMRRETTMTIQLLKYIANCNFMQKQRAATATAAVVTPKEEPQKEKALPNDNTN